MNTVRGSLVFPKNKLRRAANASSSSGAFTLVEVVLATAISAVILFGCCAMMFEMVNVVEYFERGWSLRSHADGVEKFLRSSFMNSSAVQTSEIGETLANNSAKTIYLGVRHQC